MGKGRGAALVAQESTFAGTEAARQALDSPLNTRNKFAGFERLKANLVAAYTGSMQKIT